MRVLMNECRVQTTEIQFPRTHGQCFNTYCLLLPSRRVKKRSHLEKDNGLTHKADTADEFSLAHLSQTEHFKTSSGPLHLFHFTWKKNSLVPFIHGSGSNLFSSLQCANKRRTSLFNAKGTHRFCCGNWVQAALIAQLVCFQCVYSWWVSYVTILHSAIDIKRSYPWTKKEKKSRKGNEKRFICIFSRALAPSGGFPMQITQLLS